MSTREELVAVIRDRYRGSDRSVRGAILDEFVALTGYHRKHAIRLLGKEPGTRGQRKTVARYGAP